MSAATTDLLLFQVGPRVFAAAVHDAVRVGVVRDVPAGELVVGTALGQPYARERGIVVECGGAAATLVVDGILGVRSVPEDDVRPLPAFAAACLPSAAVVGIVMMDDVPMLLVDLPTLVRERSASRDTFTDTERA